MSESSPGQRATAESRREEVGSSAAGSEREKVGGSAAGSEPGGAGRDGTPTQAQTDAERGPRDGDHDGAATMTPASNDGDPKTGREPPKFVRKLKERREAYRERGTAYRVAWVTAGVIVVIAGIVMIIFPGPALVVIPIGLAMLSLEFVWAERLLDTTLERGIDAKDIAVNASRRQQIAGAAAIVCGIGAVVAVAVIYFL